MTKLTTDDQSFIFLDNLNRYQLEVMDIEEFHREEARLLSDPIYGESQQWSVYLNGIAFTTFVQWLRRYQSMNEKGHSTSHTVDLSHCSLLNPKYANSIDAVCNLKVNGFDLCLITTENIQDEELIVPCAALDFSPFAAHLYILLEVWEEQDKVLIRGVARRDQLVQYRNSHRLHPCENLTYIFPDSLLTADPYRIFYYLQHLDPGAIALPPVQSDSTNAVYTWLDQYDDLASYVSTPQYLAKRSEATIRLQQIVTLLTQTAVDLSKWADNSLDQVSEQLGFWTTQTTSTEAVFLSVADQVLASDRPPASTRPSPESVEHFERAIAWLKEEGLAISDEIQPRYQSFTLDDIPLHLCSLIVTPNRQTGNPVADGELFILLGTQTQANLPEGTELQLSTLAGTESWERLDFPQPFLHVRALIQINKRIIPTVTINNNHSILSPYCSYEHEFIRHEEG
ncbi:MAG: DUF1822 family protein [Leptolyngbyaceae cyanobacterium]